MRIEPSPIRIPMVSKLHGGASAALVLALAACSGGGGSSSNNGTTQADIKIAADLAGVWTLSLTITSTTCTGRNVGDTDIVALLFEPNAGASTLSVRGIDERFEAPGGGGAPVSQGKTLSTEPALSGSIGGGRLRITRTFQGSQISADLGGFAFDNLGRPTFCTGTVSEVATGVTPPCTTQYDVIARRDAAVDFVQELAGAWQFTVDQVLGSLPGIQVTVGDTGQFVVRPATTYSDRFTGAVITDAFFGNFAQAPVRDITLDSERTIGEGTTKTNLAPPPPDYAFSIRFDNGVGGGKALQVTASDGTGNTLTITGPRTALPATASVAGTWSFDLPGALIAGPLEQFGRALALENPAGSLRGVLDASLGFDGVIRISAAEGRVIGQFDNTAGTFTGTSGLGPITGTRSGGGTGGGGGGNCTTVSTGTWDVFGDNGGVTFPGGSLTQSGCTVSFTFEIPGFPTLTTTLSGNLDGNRWTPTVTGAAAAAIGDVDVQFAGNPATSFSGTATNGGLPITFGGMKQ